MEGLKQFSWGAGQSREWSARWRSVGDYGIAACLFVAPLMFGGRHDLGRLLYALCVVSAATGVFTHAALTGVRVRAPRWSIVLFSLGVALLLLQSIPLPAVVIDWIAPGQQQLLPLWNGDPVGYTVGHWRTLSFTPSESREGAALLALHGLFFATICLRIRNREDIEWLIRWLAYAAIGMTLLGVANYTASNGKLLWFYAHPSRQIGDSVQGVFANRNHFAHFLVLGLGPLVWLAMRAFTNGKGSKRASLNWESIAPLGAVALVVVVALASKSRGGAAALLIALSATIALQWGAGMLRLKQAVALSMMALIAIAGVSIYGYDDIASRLDDLVSGEVDKLDAGEGRRLIWGANAVALSEWPLLGAGAGGHAETYKLYLQEPYHGEFSHAESGYLQVASETGMAGLALLVAAVALCATWVVRGTWSDARSEKLGIWSAITPGLIASLAHSVVDFVWYIPALMTFTLLLAACAARLSDFATEEQTQASSRRSRTHSPWRLAPLGGVAVGGLVCLFVLLGPGLGATHWDRYLRCSSNLADLWEKGLSGRAPVGDLYYQDTIVEHSRLATELLERVVAYDPCNARAHCRLAGRYLQRFEIESAGQSNEMPAEWVNDAAIKSSFASREELLGWLERAYGDRAGLLVSAHMHARRAVELCPLQGEAYLYLATVSMFEPQSLTAARALVDQAVRVRPYDGGVLFSAGRWLRISGGEGDGIALWRESLLRPGSHRRKLVAMASGSMPAREFIDHFRPDRPTLDLAIEQYKLRGRQEELYDLAEYAMQEARQADELSEEESRQIASRWRQTSELLRGIEEYQTAARCAERALALDPYHFPVRYEAARALLLAERYDEADPHLRWCLSRRPDINALQVWLTQTAKGRLRSARESLLTQDSTHAAAPAIGAVRTGQRPTAQAEDPTR